MNRCWISSIFFVLFFSCTFWGCASQQEKFQTFLSEGEVFFEKGEFEKAKIQCLNAIQIDPKSVQAQKLMGKIATRMNDPKEIFKTYLKIEELDPNDIEAKLHLASITLMAKRITETDQRIDFVLQKNPENIQALYIKAATKSHLGGSLEPSQEIYKKILEIDPKQIKAWLVLSKIAADKKEWDAAEHYLQTAIDIEPDNSDLYNSLYLLYIDKKDFPGALTALETLKNKHPNRVFPLIMLGKFYMGSDNKIQSEKSFLEAIEKDPQNIEARMLLAKIYNGENKPDKAENLIQEAISIAPDNIDIKSEYALFLLSRKQTDKAHKLVDSILASRPNHFNARLLKGKILTTNKSFDQAINIFQNLLNEEPENPELNLLMASTWFEKGDLSESRHYLNKTFEQQSQNAQARFLSAQIYFRQMDFLDAQSEAEIVVRIFPQMFQVNLLIGNIHMAQRHEKEARTFFKKLIQLVPDNAEGYYRMGILEKLQNNNIEALEYFSKAMELDLARTDAFANLISIYVSDGILDTAVKKCITYIDKTKNLPGPNATARAILGRIYRAKGQTENAENSYKAAIKINPDLIVAYRELADLYTNQNRIDDAIAQYEALIKVKPDSAAAYTFIGSLYERQNKTDLAQTQYETALGINNRFVPALNNLAFFLAQRGEKLEKALELAQKAKALAGTSPAVADTLGWVYLQKNLIDSAISEFKTSISQEPDNPLFHYHLGVAYNKKWDYINAKKSLQKALELQPNFDGAENAQKILDGIKS
ncbi:tetratricopeptide repeat protein [Desulfobacter postgatei]|uniref:tetratricopeptide repeat protein n=1 Tax=Desulfobacter postgatei TaxID=2293 RepID=UPI00259B267F|nr:tetratricopeptide repeat protein [uncultured Desulfobacter sp.]